MKEENNTEKKEFPKDIDYVNPYVGLDKIYEKDPYKNPVSYTHLTLPTILRV